MNKGGFEIMLVENDLDYKQFLLKKKDEINKKIKLSKIRYPSISNAIISKGFKTALYNLYKANLKNGGEINNFNEIFDRILNLFILATSRKYYTEGDSAIVLIHMNLLFDSIYPSLLPLIKEDPVALPAKIFNICEHLKKKSPIFLEYMLKSTQFFKDDLSHLYSVIYFFLWILGDPRYRNFSLLFLNNKDNSNKNFKVKQFLEKLFDLILDDNQFTNLLNKMNKDPWFNFNSYLNEKEGKVEILEIVQIGGFTGFRGGKFSELLKIANLIEDYLILYSKNQEVYFMMIDGMGCWQNKQILNLKRPMTVVQIYFDKFNQYVLDNQGKLINLVSNKQIVYPEISHFSYLKSSKNYLYFVGTDKRSRNKLRIIKIHNNNLKNKEYSKNPQRSTIYERENYLPLQNILLPTNIVSIEVNLDDQFYLIQEESGENKISNKIIYTLSYMEVGKSEDGKEDVILSQNNIYSSPEIYHVIFSKKYSLIIGHDGSLKLFDKEFKTLLSQLYIDELNNFSSIIISNNILYWTTSSSFHIYSIDLQNIIDFNKNNISIKKNKKII